jgi:hypothetical protein
MRSVIVGLLLAVAAAAIAIDKLAPPLAASAVAAQDKEPPVVCGFRHASYTGLCEERTPYVKGEKLETLCKPILDCLNDTRCIKTYCGATTIRQGWVLESARR